MLTVVYMQSTLPACENISGHLYHRCLLKMLGDTETKYGTPLLSKDNEAQIIQELTSNTEDHSCKK